MEWKHARLPDKERVGVDLETFLSGMETGNRMHFRAVVFPALKPSLVEWKLQEGKYARMISGILETFLSGMETRRSAPWGALFPAP